MDHNRLVDLQDMASEHRLNLETLKALGAVFGDSFTTDADPHRMAQNIENRAEIFTHLWYLAYDLINKAVDEAKALDDALGAE